MAPQKYTFMIDSQLKSHPHTVTLRALLGERQNALGLPLGGPGKCRAVSRKSPGLGAAAENLIPTTFRRSLWLLCGKQIGRDQLRTKVYQEMFILIQARDQDTGWN